MAREGRLQDLSGVGAAIEAKVLELLDRGTIASLEELRARYPADLLEVTRLPGLGPRKAVALWRNLGVSNVEVEREEDVYGLLG